MVPPPLRQDEVEERLAVSDDEAETVAPAPTRSQVNSHPSSNTIKHMDDEPYLAARIDNDDEGVDNCSDLVKEDDDDTAYVHDRSSDSARPGLEIIKNENDVPLPTPHECAKEKSLHIIHVDGHDDNNFTKLSKLETMEGDKEYPPPMPVAQLASSLEVIGKDHERETSKSSYSIKGNEAEACIKIPELELSEGEDEAAPPVPIEQLAASLEATAIGNNEEKGVASGTIFSERNNVASIPEQINAASQDQITPPAPGDRQVESTSGIPPTIHPTPISMLSSSQQDADEFSPPPFTVLEATLVDDVIYDAVLFQAVDYQEQEKVYDETDRWARRRKKFALLGFVSIVLGAVGMYFAIKENYGLRNSGGISSGTPNLIWKLQGQPIIGNVADDYFGSFVALSASGNVLAGGTDGLGGDRAGYAKLFHWSNDELQWEQIGPDIIDDIIEYSSSCSVALSGDGTTLAIGSEKNDDLIGHVKLYSVNGSSWQRLGDVINGEALGDHFGRSVSLSSDGRTVAIGGSKNNGNGDNAGHVRIYQIDESGSEWVQLGNEINGEAAFDQSGDSVSLSADGRVVVIGSPYHMNYFGQARVYNWNDDGSRWEKRGQDLIGRPSDDNFGKAVAISGDGQIVAVGAPASGVDSRTGYARVYARVDDDWEMKGDINGTYPGGKFGEALSLSGDGKILAVGDRFSPGEKDALMAGCARVYKFDDLSSSWIKHSREICGNITYDYFGTALSLSANGRTLAISAPEHGLDMGAVWVMSIES